MTIHYNRNYFFHLLIQGTVAVIFMFFVLFSLDMVRAGHLLWAAGASTLASSCFIVFGMPHAEVGKPLHIVLGYVIAIICGHLIRIVADFICAQTMVCGMYEQHVFELAAVISMGLCFLIMVLVRSPHPPAAGLAIVMVLDISNPKAMGVICVAAVVLALIQFFFRKYMKALV